MTASFWYCTSEKGPVPIGSWSMRSGVPALSIASPYSLDWIDAKGIASDERNGASAWFSTMRTVLSSTFSIALIRRLKLWSFQYEWFGLVTLKKGCASFHWRSYDHTMSSALRSRVGLKVRVLCHFTPLRRWKV